MNIQIVTIIFLLMVYLLISEKIRVDVTAIGVMVALMLTGILPPKEAVSGFSSPAVITVGAMFLVSQAMIRTGAVGFISRHVLRLSQGHSGLAVFVILLVVGIASAFINNTPVVVLFIPVVMALSCRLDISPSKLLIPVSYASILAGTCTLIGTSTNIIVSDLSAAAGYGALSMFELASVGLPAAIAGMAFLLFAGPRFLPGLVNPVCEMEDDARSRYLAELSVPDDSPFIGQSAASALKQGENGIDAAGENGIDVVELIREGRIYHPERDRVTIRPHDRLLVKGSANQLFDVIQSQSLRLPSSETGLYTGKDHSEQVVVELIIPPQSRLLNRRLSDTELLDHAHLNIIAIRHSGRHYSGRLLKDIKLRLGDILLVWGLPKALETLRNSPDVIVVDDVHHQIVNTRKAKIAGLIFLGLIIGASTGLADIMVCSMTAVILMIITKCIRLKDGYRALQGEVLLLIAGTIALGTAMEKTGASRFYAEAFLSLFSGLPPQWIMVGILVLTSVGTQILSNNATAVLLFPVAVSTAISLGVSPKPFIIAVCVGASACFASPLGYQTNLLVYGPGGYRFSDYVKLGMPLNGIVLIIAALLIPYFWPFYPG